MQTSIIFILYMEKRARRHLSEKRTMQTEIRNNILLAQIIPPARRKVTNPRLGGREPQRNQKLFFSFAARIPYSVQVMNYSHIHCRCFQ